jgi:hypothetical protein
MTPAPPNDSPSPEDKWIPVDERLPQDSDGDCDGHVWIWGEVFVIDPTSRLDDDTPKFISGGWKAYRENWSNIRSQRPTHWKRTGLVAPLDPAIPAPSPSPDAQLTAEVEDAAFEVFMLEEKDYFDWLKSAGAIITAYAEQVANARVTAFATKIGEQDKTNAEIRQLAEDKLRQAVEAAQAQVHDMRQTLEGVNLTLREFPELNGDMLWKYWTDCRNAIIDALNKTEPSSSKMVVERAEWERLAANLSASASNEINAQARIADLEASIRSKDALFASLQATCDFLNREVQRLNTTKH